MSTTAYTENVRFTMSTMGAAMIVFAAVPIICIPPPSQHTRAQKKRSPKRVSEELRNMADEALLDHQAGLTDDFPS